MIIYKNDEIVVPTIIQKYVVIWNHTCLLHPGNVFIDATISQHYYWPRLRENIRTHIKVYNTCQKTRKRTLNMKNYRLRKRRPFHGTDYQEILYAHIKLEDLITMISSY